MEYLLKGIGKLIEIIGIIFIMIFHIIRMIVMGIIIIPVGLGMSLYDKATSNKDVGNKKYSKGEEKSNGHQSNH